MAKCFVYVDFMGSCTEVELPLDALFAAILLYRHPDSPKFNHTMEISRDEAFSTTMFRTQEAADGFIEWLYLA